MQDQYNQGISTKGLKGCQWLLTITSVTGLNRSPARFSANVNDHFIPLCSKLKFAMPWIHSDTYNSHSDIRKLTCIVLRGLRCCVMNEVRRCFLFEDGWSPEVYSVNVLLFFLWFLGWALGSFSRPARLLTRLSGFFLRYPFLWVDFVKNQSCLLAICSRSFFFKTTPRVKCAVELIHCWWCDWHLDLSSVQLTYLISCDLISQNYFRVRTMTDIIIIASFWFLLCRFYVWYSNYHGCLLGLPFSK